MYFRALFLMLLPLLQSCMTIDGRSEANHEKENLSHEFGYVGCKPKEFGTPAIKAITTIENGFGYTYLVIHTAFCGLEPVNSTIEYEKASKSLYFRYKYMAKGGLIDPKLASCTCDYWTSFELKEQKQNVEFIFLFDEAVITK